MRPRLFTPIKISLFGLRPEVGLRRPSLNGGDEKDGRGLIPSKGLGVRPRLFMPIKISLFWPSPTLIKLGMAGAQSSPGGPGGYVPWQGVWGMCPQKFLKWEQAVHISNPPTSGTQNLGKPSANGGGNSHNPCARECSCPTLSALSYGGGRDGAPPPARGPNPP